MIARDSDPVNCIQSEHIHIPQTVDPILCDGEHWLYLGDTRVAKNTSILIRILVEVHRSPHSKNRKYSPNRFVDKNLVHWVVIRQAKLLWHVPEDTVHTRPIW